MPAGRLVIDDIENSTGDVGNTTDMIFGSAKAWVNFNGTGTVAIRNSYNVSSITDNGTGSYDINFATALPNTNYAPSITAGKLTNVMNFSIDNNLFTASAFRVRVWNDITLSDPDVCSAQVFSN